MNRKQISRYLQLAILAILTASCYTTQDSCLKKTQEKLIQTSKMLDNVQTSLNQWGKIATSDLVLIENKGQFKINFDEDVTNYVQSARTSISGDARAVAESSLYLGAALQGQFTPAISAGSPSNTTNGLPANNLPTQAQNAMTNFSPLPAVSGFAPTIDERQAVNKGVNDKVAELLIKMMINPDVRTNQQKILFGVMQVTCQPGEFTKFGYTADLSVTLFYGHDEPIVEVREDGIVPGVVAVLPLIDSKNMELQNSSRKQIELAIALSAAFAAKGMNAAANALSDYIKRQESDLNSRSSLPVATSYAQGPTFGLQIYPSFQALADPSDTKATSADVLQPITFPVVVGIIVNEKDIMSTSTASEEAKAGGVNPTKEGEARSGKKPSK